MRLLYIIYAEINIIFFLINIKVLFVQFKQLQCIYNCKQFKINIENREREKRGILNKTLKKKM